ncbi:MAG: peptidoglycan-binding protein [Eubacterium sp.]|jgi:GH25 family lysozyme M1 (1,4-beta-N-acetylmuramidase)|nr:peptidoglycan-binding protein [Eubacterium sp.]MCH4078739.1 peptidoglycan-binding protein [Eubacterium sp.]
MTGKGIDVSHWQGNINWAKVKTSGIRFAIIKAGGSDDGFYTDSKWEANYKGAKANGIAVGAYYFAGPKCVTAEAGRADAKRFIRLLKGKKLEYPVYFDCEAQPAAKRSGTTKAALAFCKELEKAGYYAGIYASTYSGFQDRLDDAKLHSIAHWVAQYAGKCSYRGDYGIWQYSSSGKVPGISGNVDMNYAYIDYPSIIKKGGFNGYHKGSTSASKMSLPATDLKRGDSGSQVIRLQECLNKIMKAGFDVDGLFGPATEKAVRIFQQKHGLAIDGIAGPKTIAKIKALL